MDLNNSFASNDTDTLVKIPHNFFEADFNDSKSYFSNDQSFMKEIDHFLQVNQQKDLLNSTHNDLPSYSKFADTLHQTQNNPNDQDSDLNMQLINIFQKKIQQCQEKIAKLTKANLEKGEIIRKLKQNEGLDVENANLRQKNKVLEEETAEMINLISKFQTKNDMLEAKIENLTSNTKEISEISKSQIQDLETRLNNSMKIEKELQKEIDILNQKYKEEKDARIQQGALVNSLKTEIKQTKEEKAKLQQKFENDKKNIELKQKKIFNNIMNEASEKCRKLIQEFDTQRDAMKNCYQTQLESAIEKKVKEFQEQLEQFQHEIREESEHRERLSSERLMNQMEMIVRKNEEEIDLIKQKCAEEVDLYRVQLINATKTIESLEIKLSDYQTKRQNIADNLHSIMETQWRKILDVLTCPSRPVSRMHEDNEHNEISESDNNKQKQFSQTTVDHYYEPTMNNLSRSEENLKSELLRNYIEKLLNEPPKMQVLASDDEKLMNRKNRPLKSKPWK